LLSGLGLLFVVVLIGAEQFAQDAVKGDSFFWGQYPKKFRFSGDVLFHECVYAAQTLL
jgi:hypothetical protein